MTPRDIESLDCELAVYRKGFLSVHINLARGYLTWRESNSWNNNFTRSLRPEQIEQLRLNLANAGWLLQLPESMDDDSIESGVASLKSTGSCRRDAGCDTLPAGWYELRQMIESVSRLPFSLH
jgi:hypothetical protein